MCRVEGGGDGSHRNRIVQAFSNPNLLPCSILRALVFSRDIKMLAGVKREDDRSSHTGLNWPLLVVPELGSSLHSVSQNSLPQELIVFIARGKNLNFKKWNLGEVAILVSAEVSPVGMV